MYDIPTYDHSKPEIQEETGPSFFHHAARFSLWASPLAAFFCMGMEHAMKGEHGSWVVFLALAMSGLVVLVFLASFVLGIIALCGMSKHGTEGILVRAVGGIILSCLFLSIFTMNFIHGFQTARHDRQALAGVRDAAQEIQAQERREFNRSHTITMESAQPKIEQVKAALDAAAASGSTDVALAARATKAYLEKGQALMLDYAAAAKKIAAPPSIFDLGGMDRREQLQAKRKIVEDFLAANEKLMGFCMKGESGFRDELIKFKVPAPMAEATLKGYRAQAGDRNYLQIKIREADQTLGSAMLGMLDLLNANWGEWKYDQLKRKPIFTDADATEKYDGYLRQIQSAAADQEQLQRQLLTMPLAASSR